MRATPRRSLLTRLVISLALLGTFAGAGVTGAGGHLGLSRTAYADSACQLGNGIQHVIYLQFDNLHLTRDNPNVPSDLEQMPHLLNFIESNGTMLGDEHTPLIAHTATDILTSVSGLYPNRAGVPVANSFRYFNPDGSTDPGVSFDYWASPIYDYTTETPSDTNYNMLDENHQNTPAPWVPFTRAGCNVGVAGIGNMELENNDVDINTAFGKNSPQAAEAKADDAKATADFQAISIHCAQGQPQCSTANGGRPDILPDEPYGYGGYQALFGAKYVDPVINPSGPLTDLVNNQVIADSNGNPGFPGFDSLSPAVSLSWVAHMQESGVPVTYAYLADAHDNHVAGRAFGPGEAGYEAQLKAYDQGFATFFNRMQADGITAKNTLYVVTADENDYFVGGAPTPANCDGVTVPCTYSNIGELDANMSGLLATQQNNTTPFDVHSDSAPTVYVHGNPGPANSTTRSLEQAAGQLAAPNPITGATDQLTNYLADPVEENILHMVTSDAARTPTFTLFANPNYYLYTGKTNCTGGCVDEETTGDAWNHGDVDPVINTTWLGMVGPGVMNLGRTDNIWTDETDIRPTMMEILGLKDDYRPDGRVITGILDPSILPSALTQDSAAWAKLGETYKQLDASVGQLGLDTLKVSTVALESNTPGDATYSRLEHLLAGIASRRDSLATQISVDLDNAEFNNQSPAPGEVDRLTAQAQALIDQVSALAKAVS